MQLPAKSLRDSYGIDSFERAIAWSTLMLRYGYQLSTVNTVKDVVQFGITVTGTGDNVQANLVIRASFLVDNDSLTMGANVLDNIQERFSGSIDWQGGTSPPSFGLFVPIIDEPNAISLEQYFYWACQRYLASDVSNYRRVQITPTFRGLNEPFTVDCTVSIPINYAVYLTTNNIVSAIGATAIVDPDPDPDPDPISTGFNNDTQLNNDYQLNNDTP